MRIFISYARADRRSDETIDAVYGALRRSHDVWIDDELASGNELNASILDEIIKADIVVALISTNFLRSDYCMNVEMEAVKRRWLDGNVSIVPIILERCEWTNFWFSRVVAFPSNGSAIVKNASWVDELLDRLKVVESQTLFSVDPALIRAVERRSSFIEDHLVAVIEQIHKEASAAATQHRGIIHARRGEVGDREPLLDISVYKRGFLKARHLWHADLSESPRLAVFDDIREVAVNYEVLYCDIHQSIVFCHRQKGSKGLYNTLWLPAGFSRRFSHALVNTLQD